MDVGDGFFRVPVFVFADGFWFGLDLACGLIVFFVFFFFKIFVAPEIFAEHGLVHGAGIDDYASLDRGLEIRASEVRRGGLQGVEQEAGGLAVQLSAESETHDLHERDLDGVGVFEHGEIKSDASATGAVGIEDDAGFMPAFMEKAEVVTLQGGRSALGAVDFEVLATGNASGI